MEEKKNLANVKRQEITQKKVNKLEEERQAHISRLK